MTIKPAPLYTQPNLLEVAPDKVFVNNASARTHYGRVVEVAVEGLLGLIDIPNCGQYDHCYDAFNLRTQGHVEIKSVHRSGSLPLYEWRIEKDLSLPSPPVYAVALHKTRGAEGIRAAWVAMSETLTTILLLPAQVVFDLSRDCKLLQLVSEEPGRMGYKRKGYCNGYRNIPAKRLIGLDFGEPVTRSFTIHDLTFTAGVLRHPDVSEQFLP